MLTTASQSQADNARFSFPSKRKRRSVLEATLAHRIVTEITQNYEINFYNLNHRCLLLLVIFSVVLFHLLIFLLLHSINPFVDVTSFPFSEVLNLQ